MNFSRYALLCLTAAGLAACSSDTTAEADTSGAPIAAADSVVPPPPPATAVDAVSYKKKLDSGSMHFLVTTLGQGSMRNLTIELEREGQQPSRIDEELEGEVTNSELTDLNNNKKPELLVFVTSGGTGSYGKIYGYEFDNRYWGELKLPELTPAQQQGYMGHDTYKVADGYLVRTFPVYQDADANCCPTGGTRTIYYTLNNSLNFAVSRVE